MAAAQADLVAVQNALRDALGRIAILEAANADAQSKMNYLEEERSKATEQLRELKATTAARSSAEPVTMIDTKGLGKPYNFNGTRAHWKGWLAQECSQYH